MGDAIAESALQPKERPDADLNARDKETTERDEDNGLHSIKDEKNTDSDAHSDDLSSSNERSNATISSNSQFYESSDSKIDYAVKIDDNDNDNTLSDIDDIKTDSASADSEDSALGSLPSDSNLNDREEEAQERAEGSDSGLGSESNDDLKIPSFNLTLPCTTSIKNANSSEISQHNCNSSSSSSNANSVPLEQVKVPTKSNLKRKRSEDNTTELPPKKLKGSIRFDNVTVFYFSRAQGFSCVPSQGGSTLGMEWEHSHIQHFTLAEHALEQRRLHRQILQQLKSERHTLQGASLSSSEDSDTEEEASDISESELDLDNYFFLQPVPTRQRRALLRAAGVRKIEGYEKDECRDIRTSREFCGCACKGTCNPETCSCSLAGIKCQVDRLNFPCGCTRDGCANTTGRIEFNPVRVRTHFIQTLIRIGMEKKNEEHQEALRRQWLEAHNSNSASCSSNSSYERERCLSHEDGMLRDVSLTPRVEVESCVNTGSFSNVHCDMNNSVTQSSMPDNMSYGYRTESSNCNNGGNTMHYQNTSNHHNHNGAYTSNILQGKGPPYTAANTMGFDAIANNMQRFQCDLNYAYEQQAENHHFKGLQTFSATRFEEFAHNSQMSMFSHYGHMYVPDYFNKHNANIHDHNALQYHSVQQNHYDMYKNNPECVNNEHKTNSHYTTLMTLPYQPNNKMQTVDNDENWFSHNTLLNLDHSDQTTQDASDLQAHSAGTATESNNVETTENFGELIKKTMVESVTV